MITPAEELIVKVLIINEAHEVLVLKLGKHFTRPENSYKPDLPGGIADVGESGESAVVRETKEETGIVLSPGNLRLVYSKTKFHDDENKSVTKLLYISFITFAPEVKLSVEHESFRWISIDKLTIENEFHGFYMEAINYVMINKLVVL